MLHGRSQVKGSAEVLNSSLEVSQFVRKNQCYRTMAIWKSHHEIVLVVKTVVVAAWNVGWTWLSTYSPTSIDDHFQVSTFGRRARGLVCRCSLALPPAPAVNHGIINRMCNDRLICEARESQVPVWSTSAAECIQSWQSHVNWVFLHSFSQDGGSGFRGVFGEDFWGVSGLSTFDIVTAKRSHEGEARAP